MCKSSIEHIYRYVTKIIIHSNWWIRMNVVLLYNYICIYIYIQISILSHLCYLCFTPLLFDFISIIETSVIFEYKYIIIYNNIKLDYSMTKFWEIGKKSVCILRNYVAHAKELNNPLPKNQSISLSQPRRICRKNLVLYCCQKVRMCIMK